MDRKYVLLTVLFLALCAVLFLYSYENVPDKPRRAKISTHKETPPEKFKPRPCPYDIADTKFMYPADPTQHQINLKSAAAAQLDKGLKRYWRDSSYGYINFQYNYETGEVTTGRAPIKHLRSYPEWERLPQKAQEALTSALVQRVGETATAQIRFVAAIEFDPPAHGQQIANKVEEINGLVSYFAIYAIDDLVEGVPLYEFAVVLDENMDVLDIEIPNIRGDFSSNILTPSQVIEKAKKDGLLFPARHEALRYENGRIFLSLQSQFHPKTVGNYDFCGSYYDLRTGEMFSGPYMGSVIYN